METGCTFVVIAVDWVTRWAEAEAEATLDVGMGTRRPGTRQDLGPGTSRGLAEESRDFLYITQPCINIGRLII